MSEKNVNLCGMCIFVDGEQPKDPQKFPGVSEVRQISFFFRDKNLIFLFQLESCWVECSTRTCRAHYVVEDVPALKVCLLCKI